MAERKGIMLCYPFEEKRLQKWQSPYLVQPKLDGERCRAILDHGEVHLLSSSEQEIVSVPHINQQLSRLCTNSKRIELDGELYVHGTSFDEIQSIVSRTTNLHPEHEKIEYHVFDLVHETKSQWERILIVKSLLESEVGNIRRVPELITENLDDILRAYDKVIESGYEGIVVRNFHAEYIRKRSTYLMKFKPKKSDYYKIVGVVQMRDKDGNLKEMLGALICASDHSSSFRVGSGMNDEFRKKWWPKEEAFKLIGKIAHIQYQHTTSGKGVPRFPVFVEIIDPEEVR